MVIALLESVYVYCIRVFSFRTPHKCRTQIAGENSMYIISSLPESVYIHDGVCEFLTKGQKVSLIGAAPLSFTSYKRYAKMLIGRTVLIYPPIFTYAHSFTWSILQN